jgi:hypothetical protein
MGGRAVQSSGRPARLAPGERHGVRPGGELAVGATLAGGDPVGPPQDRGHSAGKVRDHDCAGAPSSGRGGHGPALAVRTQAAARPRRAADEAIPSGRVGRLSWRPRRRPPRTGGDVRARECGERPLGPYPGRHGRPPAYGGRAVLRRPDRHERYRRLNDAVVSNDRRPRSKFVVRVRPGGVARAQPPGLVPLLSIRLAPPPRRWPSRPPHRRRAGVASVLLVRRAPRPPGTDAMSLGPAVELSAPNRSLSQH